MYRECPLCHTMYLVPDDSSYGCSCPHCGPFGLPTGPVPIEAEPYEDLEGPLAFGSADGILGEPI